MGGERTPSESSSPLFDGWLADATRGLCEFAKGQVREEYEDHFTAAYEDLRAEGLGEEQAERTAVESLGNAKRIPRKLRRVFLTSGEDIRLGRLVRSRTALPGKHEQSLLLRKTASVATFLIVGGFAVFGAYLVGTKLWDDAGMLLGGIAVFTMLLARRGFCVPRYVRTNSLEDLLDKRAQFSLAWTLVMSWLLFSIIAFPPDLRKLFSPGFAEAFGAIGLLGFVLNCLSGFREFLCMKSIRRKLRRFPKQTATSSVLALRVLVEHSCEPESSG